MTNLKEYSFLYRTVGHWDGLNKDTVEGDTVHTVNKKLDKYLLESELRPCILQMSKFTHIYKPDASFDKCLEHHLHKMPLRHGGGAAADPHTRPQNGHLHRWHPVVACTLAQFDYNSLCTASVG